MKRLRFCLRPGSLRRVELPGRRTCPSPAIQNMGAGPDLTVQTVEGDLNPAAQNVGRDPGSKGCFGLYLELYPGLSPRQAEKPN